MTNKTPIQELIDYLYSNTERCRDVNSGKLLDAVDSVKAMFYAYQIKEQKEKAFAFDCFDAGFTHHERMFMNIASVGFDEFYSQYAAKHIN